MGQKTNPIIFQLGKHKKWENIFEEKKRLEFAKYTENQLEIQKFVKKYFKQQGLKICDYNLYYKNNNVTIFISYFIIKLFFQNLNFEKKKYKNKKTKSKKYFLSKQKKFLKLKKVAKKIYKNYLTKYVLKKNKAFYKTVSTKNFFFRTNFLKKFIKKRKEFKKKILEKEKFKKFYKKTWRNNNNNKNWKNKRYYNNNNKHFNNSSNVYKKKNKIYKNKLILTEDQKKLKIGRKYYYYFLKKKIKALFKTYKLTKKHSLPFFTKTLTTIKSKNTKNYNDVTSRNFFEPIFEVIRNYDFNIFNINLNLKQISLSKNINKSEYQILKQKLGQLWWFQSQPYYKQGLNAILLLLKFPQMVEFFTEYVAEEMQNHKRQHFFLNFIQKGLLLFNKSMLYPSKNIKIKINGRFNGAPRSKQRIIEIGEKISVISADTRLYYSEKISISKRGGTFGIKVWVSNNLKNVQRTKKNKV